jgi:hypothetical protein
MQCGGHGRGVRLNRCEFRLYSVLNPLAKEIALRRSDFLVPGSQYLWGGLLGKIECYWEPVISDKHKYGLDIYSNYIQLQRSKLWCYVSCGVSLTVNGVLSKGTAFRPGSIWSERAMVWEASNATTSSGVKPEASLKRAKMVVRSCWGYVDTSS